MSVELRMDAIQVDGGGEFASVFADMCCRYDIQLFVNHPHTPKQNAFVERIHRTFDEECYQTRYFPSHTCEAINREITNFCIHYNYHRPHWGIGLRTPGEELIRLARQRDDGYTVQTRVP